MLTTYDMAALCGVCDRSQSMNRCVSALEHRDGDRQVSERASERHQSLINIMSGPIRVGTVIAGTRPVPAGLPWISLSLPLPWQCLITGNHQKHFFFVPLRQ